MEWLIVMVYLSIVCEMGNGVGSLGCSTMSIFEVIVKRIMVNISVVS